ncbi:MAG TPA: hypothetical protein PLC13_03575 [Bacillota bacterium]|mgnify:CR=1 FL=1|nr:hypothetical protein [Bacillota bacterium]
MKSMNEHIVEYTLQLQKGDIQKAYKDIMLFMAGLKKHMEKRHAGYKTSAVYPGYMDMTYFAFTPAELRDKNLKIAIVYLHEENRFEAWLGGVNRSIQGKYIEIFKGKNIGRSKLSKAAPGVDSILELELIEKPDFDDPYKTMILIEKKTMDFSKDIISFLNMQGV